MIHRAKYWIPMFGAILFHFEYGYVHYIDMVNKYPFFVMYHTAFFMICLITVFNLMV